LCEDVVGAGGRLDCDLSSRSRTHMLRGHVPPVEAGKAHEIVTSVGKKWGHFASMHARKVGPVFCVYLPGRPAIGALTVDRQAVTWLGPSPIYLTRPCLQRIEAIQNSTSLSNFSDTSAEQSINRDYIYPCQCGHDLVATLSRQIGATPKSKDLGRDTVRRWLPNRPTAGGNYFRSLADRSVR